VALGVDGPTALGFVGTLSNHPLQFRVNNTAYWGISSAAPGTFYPWVDNSYDIGTAGFRVRSGYFGTSLVAPAILAPGALTFGVNGGSGHWTLDTGATLRPLFDASYDIGSASFRVRNIYMTGTVSGSIAPVFESAELTVAIATVVTAAHGLGRVPKMWHAFLRCKTAQANYAVGDEVVAASFMDSGGNACNFSTYADATNVGVVIGSTQVTLANRTGGAIGQNVGLTLANWRLVIRVWG
jgi:hypothetical protein